MVTKRSKENTEPMAARVVLCIHSQTYNLNGRWTWDMQSTAVYCSNVMNFPQDFEGTRGIIHPDDLHKVSRALQVIQDKEVATLDFRLITTYGEVKTLSGKTISLDKTEKQAESSEEQTPWVESLQLFALQREAEYLQQRRVIADLTEELYNIGAWAINKATGEAWYSDGVYRIHGLPPQSLNAHANTFQSFLHPDDNIAFLDAFEAAYAGEVPIHIEYRIQLPNGVPRTVRLVSYWSHNSKGQPVFTGILHDQSEEAAKDQQVSEAQGKVLLHQQVLKFSEQYGHTGYWFLDLVTRKITYSDNYYRIFGLKAQTMPASTSFLNLVHPDDREQVRSLFDGIYKEHQLPEAEFRIVRPDGRQRQLKQSGRLFHAGANPLMIGVIQDVTVQRSLEKKVAELNERHRLQETIRQITEVQTDTAFLTWTAEGHQTWSENFYRLLGYKPGAVEPASKLLHRQIHPDDLGAFKDAETLVINGQNHEGLRFRISNRGVERQLAISFHRAGIDANEVVVGLVKDLTREENLLRKLTEITHYTETLEQSASDILFLTDAENTVLSWNRATEAKTGIKATDAIYSNLFDLFPLLLNETYMAQLQTARSGSEMRELKARNLYLRKPHNYFLVPIKNENGEVSRVLHVVQDVSRELDLQLQLSERLNFIESLVEASVDRIVVLDHHMNYVYWNRKAAEYYAIAKEKVIGRNILEVFPGLRNDPSYNEFRKVLRGETVYLPPVAVQEDSNEYFETYLIPVKSERGEVSAILWIVHDLSNELQLQLVRRKAQEQLAEEHRRLKEAQAIGHVGSFEWDILTGGIHWSDEMYRIHGLEPQSEALDPEKILVAIHPDDRPEAQQKLARCRNKPGLVNMTYRIVLPDGSVRMVSQHIQSSSNDKGQITHLSGTVQDITEQQKVREEARAKQELLQATMDSSQDIIQVFEAVRNERGEIVDFRYVLLNHEAEKWMPGALGKSLLQLQPGVLDEGIFQAFKQVTETGIAQQYEKHYVHEQFNGWFYQSVVKLNDGVATTTRDITGRKKAEQEVLLLKEAMARQATDKYYSLFNSIDEGFCVIELLYNEAGKAIDFRFLEVNEVYGRETGQQNPAGKLGSEVTPNSEPFWLETYDKIARTGEPVRFEKYHNDTGRWYNTFASRVGGEGSHQVAIVFSDVTERKRSEERQSYLLRLSDVLRSLADPLEIQAAATDLLGQHLKVHQSYYGETIGDYISIPHSYGNGLPPMTGKFRHQDFGKRLVEGCRTGKVQVCYDTAKDPTISEDERKALTSANIGAYIAAPLVKHGEWVATLAVRQIEARQWTPVDIELVQETAERTWAAVERAKVQEALRQSEVKFRRLSESGIVAVAFFDIGGPIVEANDAFLDMLGVTKEELQSGKVRWDVYTPEEWMPRTLQAIEELRNTGCIRPYEKQFFHSGGELRWGIFAGATLEDGKTGVSLIVDITERKKAEEQLKDFTRMLEQQVELRAGEVKESAALVEEIAMTTPDRITIHDALTTQILYTNHPDFWKDLYGDNDVFQQTEEKRAVGLVHPDEQEKFRSFLQERNELTDQEVSEIELRLKGEKWVRIRSKVFKRDGEGMATQIISFTTDITEQKKAEIELQMNLAILQHTEDLAQIGSWEYDTASGRFNWSDGMYQLFGLQKNAQVRPETYLDFATAEDRPVAKRIIKNLVKSHQPFEETLHINKAGGQRLLQLKASVVRNEKGEVERLVGVDLDITDIKEAEEKVKETQHWLHQTALASPDSITIYDLQKKKPVYLNNCLAEWIGSTSENLIAMGVEGRLQLVHTDDRLRLLHFNEMMKAADDGKIFTIEYRIHAHNDTLRWIRNRSKVFQRNARGEVTHILSILQDITEEKAAERILTSLNASLEKKNQELEQKNEEITSFAFVASHDLREPLRKIHTFSDWLLMKELSLSETGRQNVEKMTAAVKRLELLISDILALTKVHVGNDRLKPVDLNRLVQQVQEEMREKIQRTGAVLEVAQLPSIIGAENQLFYLLKNLISNAIKFQSKGNGPVIRIRAENDGVNLRISITDNGLGIAPEYHKKIFEMFRRLHSGEEYEGTGMGLAICKKIMEKHGGKITVDSTPGQGTTFICWFPASLSTSPEIT